MRRVTTFHPTGLTLCAACWLCACTGGSPPTIGGRGDGPLEPSRRGKTERPDVATQTRTPSQEAARTPAGPACTTGADCNACSTERGCGCFATAEACPPTLDSCFVSPCQWRAAACAEGRCVLLPASGPCNSDDECETRPDPFRCAHVPARKGAPKVKAEFGCGERPDPPAVRCDEAKHECVLGSHDGTP